jgi:transcriptional regulator with XRE-family HTH domain
VEQASPTRPGVGAFVCLARQRRGMSQRTLSSQAELSVTYVSKVERETVEPSFRAMSAIVVALQLNALEVWTLSRVACAVPKRHTSLASSIATTDIEVSQ